MSDKKKILFIMRKSPYGTIYSFEGLESVLVMGAYEQDISLLFVDDGVYTLKKDMDTSALGIKNFSPAFKALGGYDIDKLYIDKDAMDIRGLTMDELVVQPELVEEEEIIKLIEEQDVVFPF